MSRPATKFGLRLGSITWNDDFKANLDDKGLWTGSVSFTCNYADVPKILPKLKSPCQEPGWSFMSLKGVDVNNNSGDTAVVNCQYTGTVTPEFQFDEEDPEEVEKSTSSSSMASTVTESPLEQHPKYAAVTDTDKQKMQELKNGRFKLAATQSEGKLTFITRVDDEGVEKIEFTDPLAIELATFIAKGVFTYLQATPVYRYTYTSTKKPTGSALNQVGKISTPVDAPSVSGGRNWLMTALNYEQDGNSYSITGEYRLSGVDGWDTLIYTT